MTTDYLEQLEPGVRDIVALDAVEIAQSAAFPQAALDASGQAGLLGQGAASLNY